MIGILLMLVTTGAVCGVAALQWAKAMNGRIRVPVREASESTHSD